MDGTLFDGFLAAEMTKSLTTRPGCDAVSAEAALNAIQRYSEGAIDHAQCARDFYEAYGKAVTGLPVTVLQDVAQEVWRRARRRLFGHAAPLVAWLRSQNMTVCLMSGSPDSVVSLAAGHLGITQYWALTVGQANGFATGQIEQAPALEGAKFEILKRATRTVDVDWANSFAIGDSSADIGVLCWVGNAVAFEPDGGLRRVAEEREWTVTDRHDVLRLCREL